MPDQSMTSQDLSPNAVRAKAARVKLLLMDVDGVMTDGRLFTIPDASGKMAETKGFDSQDGIALQWLVWHDIRTGLISGRDSPATVERARQCKMTYVYQGHIEKIPVLEEILEKAQVNRDEVCYIGDDLTDIVVMNRVGLAVATRNAREQVKSRAHYVTSAEGGRGAVREVAELILEARGVFGELLKKYEAL